MCGSEEVEGNTLIYTQRFGGILTIKRHMELANKKEIPR